MPLRELRLELVSVNGARRQTMNICLLLVIYLDFVIFSSNRAIN